MKVWDRNRTRDPWICSQTRICCQTRYRLRYAARFKSIAEWSILQYFQPSLSYQLSLSRVPTEIKKHNSMIFFMIFHDQQCNFHDYLICGLQPPFLAASSPR